jgi:hypothetical protein
MPRKLTTDEFIRRSKEKHGDRYDYSISTYENRRTKIQYICKTHGIVLQNPLSQGRCSEFLLISRLSLLSALRIS